jgi:hypothetical protein
MRAQQWKIAAIVLAVVAGGATYAWADVAATVNINAQGFSPLITNSGTPWNTDYRVYGWRFFVTKPMVITHVGVFGAHRDAQSQIVDDGLHTTHQMGIWGIKRAGGLDLLRGPLPIGPGGAVEDHYVYVALEEPLTMTPDDPTYDRLLLGVWTGVNNTDLFYHGPVTAQTLTAQQAGAIQMQNYTYYYNYNGGNPLENSTVFTYPWGAVLDAYHYFALNFKYTLVGSNRPPMPVNDDASTQINTPVTIDVLANDGDLDGDVLSIDSCTQGANGGTVAPVEGGLKYTPPQDFVGSDTFEYTVSDGEATATATVSVTVNPGTILIDIKPGSSTNSINLGSYGVVPVAILSTLAFDAATLDPDMIFLEGTSVAIRGKGNKSMSHAEDVNGDGIADLVVQFDTENLDPDAFLQDGMATVTVETDGQVRYQGEDSIVIVPPAP